MALIDLFGFGPRGWGALLLVGAGMTIIVTLVALAIGAAIGTLVAAAKLSRNWVANLVGEAYTLVFRGVPELLIIYLVYFGGSHAMTQLGALVGVQGFFGMPSFLAGALAVGIISASYQAEVFRGAYLAVAPGEIEAARSVGMSPMLNLRRVIGPQVLRFALPGLGNVWQLSLKDSALVSVTGLAELMRTTQVAAGSTRQYFAFYILGLVLYLIITGLSNQVFEAGERSVGRTFKPGRIGGRT